MKKIAFILSFIFAAAICHAQNYADSTITLKLTQRAAYWISHPIKQNFDWSNRNAPTQLKGFIGSGNNPDSLFTTTLKAKLIKDMLEQLISRPLLLTMDDYNSIVLGSPAIPGYISLQTQILTKANGNSSEKLAAKYVLDYFLKRKAYFKALYDEGKTDIINWSRN